MKEKEKLKKIRKCKVPTKDIEADLKEFQKEVDDLLLETEAMLKNKTSNRLDIYMRTGAIFNRQETIAFLEDVLEYRKINN